MDRLVGKKKKKKRERNKEICGHDSRNFGLASLVKFHEPAAMNEQVDRKDPSHIPGDDSKYLTVLKIRRV